MSKTLAPEVVVEFLIGIGLLPLSAQRAAADARLIWTEDAIVACLHDIDNSGMKSPPAALWTNYLLRGQLPPLPKVKPIPDANAIDTSCPVCKGDIHLCHGFHGYGGSVPCWQCHKPMSECQGMCKPLVPAVRRTTRNKRREDAA
jgi:hypothetical protein